MFEELSGEKLGMRLSIQTVGEYQLIRIEEELSVISDLEELFFLVKGYVEQGKTKIAVCFPNATYIYSGAIAVLLKCFKKVQSDRGELCIIESNPDIKNILITLNIDRLVRILDSEDQLLKASAS